jgi:hypothetical protein
MIMPSTPPAGHRDQQRFDEQLRHDAAAACAEREAQRELARARGGAGEHQVGDVETDQDQHRDGQPAEDCQRLRERPGQRLTAARRVDQHHARRLRTGASDVEPRHERLPSRINLLTGRFARHARLHARDDAEPPFARILQARRAHHLDLHRHRHADIARGAELQTLKLRRRDADDRERVIVHGQRAADDARIAAEAALPIAMTDDHDRMSARHAVVVWRQHAAEFRREAEHFEVVARYQFAADTLRDTAGRLRGFHIRCEATRGHDTVDRLEVAQLAIERIGEARTEPPRIIGAAEEHQRCRIVHRHHLHHHGVHEAENGGVGANADGDREDGGEGEGGGAAQPAEAVARIGGHLTEKAKAAGLAALFLPAHHVAELRARPALRFRAIQPAFYEVIGTRFEMEAPLVVHLPIEPPLRDSGAKAAKHARE